MDSKRNTLLAAACLLVASSLSPATLAVASSPPTGWPADINLTIAGSAGFDGTYAFPWDEGQSIYWRDDLPPSYDLPVIYGNVDPSRSTFELYGIIDGPDEPDTPWGSGRVQLSGSSLIFDQWTGTGQLEVASFNVPEPASIGVAGLVVAGHLVSRRRKAGR